MAARRQADRIHRSMSNEENTCVPSNAPAGTTSRPPTTRSCSVSAASTSTGASEMQRTDAQIRERVAVDAYDAQPVG